MVFTVVRQFFKPPNLRLLSACTLLGKRKFLLGEGAHCVFSVGLWRTIGGRTRSPSGWGGDLPSRLGISVLAIVEMMETTGGL